MNYFVDQMYSQFFALSTDLSVAEQRDAMERLYSKVMDELNNSWHDLPETDSWGNILDSWNEEQL